MTQAERRRFLIQYLLDEQNKTLVIPNDCDAQKQMLRALMNIRPGAAINPEFLKIQDAYLQHELSQRGIVTLDTMKTVRDDIYLWRGDITRLQCDAIVNAANCEMQGCFVPCHGCIDNAIHSAAGLQLRMECADIMRKQIYPEKTGRAKITKAYNLPCKYVIHTVGPIVSGTSPTDMNKQLLSSCYKSCLNLAAKYQLTTIAFPCISTGEFHFPNAAAAKIAIDTVMEYQSQSAQKIAVVFNVFKEIDYDIYAKLLG